MMCVCVCVCVLSAYRYESFSFWYIDYRSSYSVIKGVVYEMYFIFQW